MVSGWVWACQVVQIHVKGVGLEKASDLRPHCLGVWFLICHEVYEFKFGFGMPGGSDSCERCWLAEGLESEASWPWALMFDMIQVYGFRLSLGITGGSDYMWEGPLWRRPRIWGLTTLGFDFWLVFKFMVSGWGWYARWLEFRLGGATSEKTSELRPRSLWVWFLICFQVYGFRWNLGMLGGLGFSCGWGHVGEGLMALEFVFWLVFTFMVSG